MNFLARIQLQLQNFNCSNIFKGDIYLSNFDKMREPKTLLELTSGRVEDLIRKATDNSNDPAYPELSALTDAQRSRADPILSYASEIPATSAEEMLNRVLLYDGSNPNKRKASPIDAWVLVHPYAKRMCYRRPDPGDPEAHRKRHPVPNVHKALLEAVAHRCCQLRELDISGMDDHATMPDNNDFLKSGDCREHYLHVLESGLRRLPHLTTLVLGTLASNSVLRAAAETAGSSLREVRICGPAPQVTDLGVRYLVGQAKVPKSGFGEAEDDSTTVNSDGCPNLRVLCLNNVDRISLSTLSQALLHLNDLRNLEHNFLHEALFLMHKTGKFSSDNNGLPPLKLTAYNGSTPAQCESRYLDVLRELCPNLENLRLCASYDDTVLSLAKGFRRLRTLVISRVATMKDFDLPLMAFGNNLVSLELHNVCHFQSGTALHIRRHCPNLVRLTLEIDSTDSAGGNNGDAALGEALNQQQQQQGQQSVWALQNQVDDLQSRLNRLQVTMLGVMDKYGPMSKLEHLTLRNLSMGSLLILLPFAPNLKTLSMKYREVSGANNNDNSDSVPNLTDELFSKIFAKNKFQSLESVLIWCKSLSSPTANWLLDNCTHLRRLRNLSFWNLSDDESVTIWRRGKNRTPDPVEVDF